MDPALGDVLFVGQLVLFGFSAILVWRLFGGRPDLGSSMGVMLLAWLWLIVMFFGVSDAVAASLASLVFLFLPALDAALGHVFLRRLPVIRLP